MFHGVAVDGSTSFVAGESVDEEEGRRSHMRTLMCRPQLVSLATREQAALALVRASSPRAQQLGA